MAMLAFVVTLVLAAGAGAGTFKADSVVNSVTLNPTSVLVIVHGTARYEGVWDQNDDHALIQTTHYNTTANGGAGQTGAGSPPCGFQPWAQETILPVAGGPQLVNALPSHTYALRRTEERDGFVYLMEEWALLAVDRAADEGVRDVEVLAASSSAYGAYRRDSLVTGIEESASPSSRETYDAMAKGPLVHYFRPGRSILLALDAPVHRHDDRWVPTPAPRFPSTALEAPGDPGKAVVRADFAEDRSRIGLEVLYADRPLSREERAILEDGLRLEYASEKPHRAVLFAVLALGERIELERSVVSLPQCCCTGGATCIPHPPQ
jgi:hypothetical protein